MLFLSSIENHPTVKSGWGNGKELIKNQQIQLQFRNHRLLYEHEQLRQTIGTQVQKITKNRPSKYSGAERAQK